jgi:Arc/MetJ-type ribon-helix-helix transcriptional regulator
MKKKVSISMDDKVLASIDGKLKDGLFRNKSHFIEYAVRRMLK